MPQNIQDMINAFDAYNEQHRGPRLTEITDVTDKVLEYTNVLKHIGREAQGIDAPTYLNAGRSWNRDIEKRVEACLVGQNKTCRAFVTDGPFCNASYFTVFEFG